MYASSLDIGCSNYYFPLSLLFTRKYRPIRSSIRNFLPLLRPFHTLSPQISSSHCPLSLDSYSASAFPLFFPSPFIVVLAISGPVVFNYTPLINTQVPIRSVEVESLDQKHLETIPIFPPLAQYVNFRVCLNGVDLRSAIELSST